MTSRLSLSTIGREVVRILNDPVVKQRSEASGGYIKTSTPDEFAAFMRREAARWGTALKELGMHYD